MRRSGEVAQTRAHARAAALSGPVSARLQPRRKRIAKRRERLIAHMWSRTVCV
jgi:hypothetical protein